jgi:hypothetical protein
MIEKKSEKNKDLFLFKIIFIILFTSLPWICLSNKSTGLKAFVSIIICIVCFLFILLLNKREQEK